MFRVFISGMILFVLVVPAESFSLRRRGDSPRSRAAVGNDASFSNSVVGRQERVSDLGTGIGVHVQLEPVANASSDGGFFESFGAGVRQDNRRSLPSDRVLSAERPAFLERGRQAKEPSGQKRNLVAVGSQNRNDAPPLSYRGQFYGSSPVLFDLDPGLVQRWDMVPELRPAMDVKGPGM